MTLKYYNDFLFVVDVIKGEKMNPVFDEPPNPTNVEDTLQRIKADDASLTEVNLNNIKVSAIYTPYVVQRKVPMHIKCPGAVM